VQQTSTGQLRSSTGGTANGGQKLGASGHRRHRGVVFVLAISLAPPLFAQGGFELGAFAQATYFDRTLQFHQGSGGGGARLGFFFTPGLEVEAEGAFVPTTARGGQEVKYFPLRGRLLLNVPAGEHTSLLLGGGYVHSEFRDDLDASDDGATALVGVRLGLPGLPSIRLATYLDYIPSPQNGAGENWNWGLQAGLSFLTEVDRAKRRVEEPAEVDSVALAARQDSLEQAARADSLARARADSLRAQAVRDSVERAQRDSLRLEEERRQARAQALSDSLMAAAREDSLHAMTLRETLRITRDRTRNAELRDSLERLAMRDSLRAFLVTPGSRVTVANFELNKATLLPVSRENVKEAARALVANSEITVEVAGHTDTTGPRELNERLSLERAEAVKAFLIENRVAAERMTTRGYAWDQPVASNATASGRAQNRRTELRRTD
jgi:outer membrane protein OmpA-like peptidoglycan-associated protein